MTRRTLEVIVFIAALLLAALAFHAWLSAHDEQLRLQSTLATQEQLIDAASIRERSRDATLANTLAQIDKLKHANQTPEQIASDLQEYLDLPQPISIARGTASSTSPQLPPMAQRFRGKLALNNKKQNPEQGTGFPKIPSPPSASSQLPASSALDPPPPVLPGTICANLANCPPVLPSSSLPTPPAPPALASPSCATPSDCPAEIPASDLKPLYNYVQDCRACQAELAVARQNASDDASKIAALTRERNAAITASKGGTFWRRLRRNALWLSVGAVLGYAAASR
jgi:hypothetical protein